MLDPGLARALSLAIRLLTASCGAAVLAGGVLAAPGCGRCTDYEQLLTLSSEPSETHATLRGVVARIDGFAAAVGDGGVIVVRYQGGRWRVRDSGTTADLFAVASPPDMLTTVAVGAGGVVVRSDDQGETWTLADSGVDVDLRGVAFFDEQIVVAVGDGVVLRSDDAGQSWTRTTVPAGLRAVVAMSESLAYGEDMPRSLLAVGDAGLALRSDDAGQSWQRIDVGTQADLRAAAVGYPSIGQMFVVVDANGEVRREREGEWEPVALAEEGDLLGLSTEGDWLVGAGGVVLARHAVGDGEFGDYGLAGTAAGQPRLLAAGGSTRFGIAVGEGGAVVRADVADVEVGTHGCLQLAGGRPFAVDAEDRVAAPTRREDWAERIAVDELPAEPRARLAAAWTRDGLREHASIAAFARTLLQLLAVGAPPGLIHATRAALADEVDHARRCFGLAAAYAGEAVGPGPLVIDGALAGPRDLAALAAATVREGCIGETIAAVIVSTAAALARDPAVRANLEVIAADERRHAALAWRTVAWALLVGDDAVRRAVSQAFVEPSFLADEPAGGLEAHGRLSAAAQTAAARAAWHRIIAPQAAVLRRFAACSPSTSRV